MLGNVRVGSAEKWLAAVVIPARMYDGLKKPPCTVGLDQALREHFPVLLDEIDDRRAMLHWGTLCRLIGREHVVERMIEPRDWHEWLIPAAAARTCSTLLALRKDVLAQPCVGEAFRTGTVWRRPVS